MAVDEYGRARRIIIGPGQQSDYVQARGLVKGFRPKAVLADKGYDAGWLVRELKAQGVEDIVIPSLSTRKLQRVINRELYKQRNKIERYFNRLKNWRRVATRFDKLAGNFASLVYLAATIINFKITLNTT